MVYPSRYLNSLIMKQMLWQVFSCMKAQSNMRVLKSSGQSTRLPPLWPGFDSQTRRHLWFEFVGSLFWSERFSPLLKKPYI